MPLWIMLIFCLLSGCSSSPLIRGAIDSVRDRHIYIIIKHEWECPVGRSDHYKHGDNNVICDRCGFKYKASQLRREWNGLWTCPFDWEPRHPQDLIKSKHDDQRPSLSRPGAEDIFIPAVPFANAGIDQHVTEGDVVQLDGSLSGDPNGLQLTYKWIQVSGINVTLSSSVAQKPTFVAAADSAGFSLVVNNGGKSSQPDSVSIVVSISYQTLILSRNPIAYWRLGEASADTVAVDEIGAHNGTYLGAVTKEQAPLIANNVDTSILVGANASTSGIILPSPVLLGGTWTLEAWIKRAVKINAFHTIFFNQSLTMGLYIRNGFIDYWDGGQNTSSISMDTTVSNHVVMVYNVGTFRMYINGIDATRPPPLDAAGNMGDVLYLGYNSVSEAFDGWLDELTIYNYGLSATDVQENYSKGAGV